MVSHFVVMCRMAFVAGRVGHRALAGRAHDETAPRMLVSASATPPGL
ncbi:hypothetical protein ACFJGV_04285 [Cnuibacter sp. UC19_7]